MKTRLAASFLGVSLLLLAACEDEGNPGDDSLLSGLSLIIVLVVVAVITGVVLMRRRS